MTDHNALNIIEDHALVREWQQLRTQFDRLQGSVPNSWSLASLICEALGSDQQRGAPATAALGAAQMAIIVIDDLLDNDPEGIFHEIGVGPAANLASALQAISLDLIASGYASTGTVQAMQTVLNTMLSRTAYGQALDILNPQDEEGYWRVVAYKSTPYYAAAFALGALAAEASPEVVRQCHQLGEQYGEMIQIHDDLKDCLSTPADPDWIEGRSPLPILFASVVAHPEQARFLALRGDILAGDNLSQAQDILVRCGAVSYCLDQLVARYEISKTALLAIPAAHPQTLKTLFNELVEPMKELLETGGMPVPETLATLL